MLAYQLRFQWSDVPGEITQPLSTYLPLVVLVSALSLLFFSLGRLYDHPRQISVGQQLYGIFSGTSVSVLLSMALLFLFKENMVSRLFVLLGWAVAILIVPLSRIALRWLLVHLHSKGIGVERLLVVGATDIAFSLAENVSRYPDLGYQLVAVDNAQGVGSDSSSRHDLAERLGTIIREQRVDEVIVALPPGSHAKVSEIVQCCRRNNVRVKVVPEFFDMALSRVDLEQISRIPLVSFKTSALCGWNEVVKRLFEASLVGAAMIALAPLFLVVAMAIKLDSPGPAIYRQTRVGRGGKSFQIYKFRSMRPNAEQLLPELMEFNEVAGPLFKLRNDPRVTRVGKLIRRLSIDEFPQLFNVLQGTMCLVGPRPPLPWEVEQYEEWQLRRLEAKPGITGLWQISGRSDLSFSDMVNLDLYYIDNWSLGLDLTILLRTIPTVLSAKGAY
ncbi:MAG: sugar transferase [Chloroflexi bacterium]|nr:sugar transferase [Chloroflexota bacterium]